MNARGSYFRSLHETDLPRCPQFGRYRGESGHGGYPAWLPFGILVRTANAQWETS
jgi:hypothetical protein